MAAILAWHLGGGALRSTWPRGRLSAMLLCAGMGLLASLPAKADAITVTHWGAQFFGAPYALALVNHDFERRKVDVTAILTAPGGGTAIRNTLAGDIPVGEVALAAVVQAMAAGQKLVIVGGGAQNVADELWVVRKGSPLASLKDLVGKKVAYTQPGSTSNMVLLMALKQNGIEAGALRLIPAGDLGACLAALLSGAVDAAYTDLATYAANADKLQPVFHVRDTKAAQMMQTVVITTPAYAKQHGDVVRAILAARRDGLVALLKDPDRAAPVVAKAYNSTDAARIGSALKQLIDIDYWSDGRLSIASMNNTLEGLRLSGQLKREVNWSEVIDTSYLPADLQTLQ